MLVMFGHPVEWCWFNSFIQHYWISNMLNPFGLPVKRCWFNIFTKLRSTLLNPTCWTRARLTTLVNGIEVCNLTLLHVYVFNILARAGQMDIVHCCSHHKTKEESLNGVESKSWNTTKLHWTSFIGMPSYVSHFESKVVERCCREYWICLAGALH